MRNKTIFRMLTGEDVQKFSGVDYAVVCYVDDVQHIIGHRSNKILQDYLKKLHMLNIGIYGANFLKINPSKTEFIHIRKTKERNQEIKITDESTEISSTGSMKILGFVRKNRDLYFSHLGMVEAVVNTKLTEIQPSLKFMNLRTRREIIYSKIASTATYSIELYYGQNQRTVDKRNDSNV